MASNQGVAGSNPAGRTIKFMLELWYMRQLSKILTYSFYAQLVLLALGGIIILQNRNANDLNGLYSLLFLVPALMAAPIIALTSLATIIKQARPTYMIIFAFIFNTLLGLVFVYRVLAVV